MSIIPYNYSRSALEPRPIVVPEGHRLIVYRLSVVTEPSVSPKRHSQCNENEWVANKNGASVSINYEDILPILSTITNTWNPQHEAAVLEPFSYITANPGKEIRGKIIHAFNLWLHVPDGQLSTISKIVGMLHSASLLIDDIEDDSHLRRGVPVAHKIFGIPQTINTANYVYFLAYQELFALVAANSNNSTSLISDGCMVPSLLSDENHQSSLSDHSTLPHFSPASGLQKLVNDELLSLHRGQGMELLWRDSLQCPTEEQYISMVNNKTGGLLRIAIRLMMACAKTNVDVNYVPLVNLIGVFFQIRDDYLNLQGSEYSANKGFAEDLTEGKFSFPIIHAVRADTSNRQILNVLQKRPKTLPLKVHAIQYMKEQTKSFEYTLSVMSKLEAQARAEIHRLGNNDALNNIMDILHVE